MVQWRGRRQSENVEDVRGTRFRARGAGAGLLPLVLRLFGIKGVVVIGVVGLGFVMLGGDLSTVTGLLMGGGGTPVATKGAVPPGQQQDADFARTMLADTEDVWHAVFIEQGRDYINPTLVLFTEAVPSGCGFASAAVGPFYCPRDSKVYIDLAFYDELSRMGGRGDFAQAYVLAHEVGHHVENLLGVLDRADAQQRSLPTSAANAVQVRVELMADCLAGVWAARADQTKGILEPGDIQEGLDAAAAVGDDTLQRQATGRVVPDSFTHGSAAQRVEWFNRGLHAATIAACDTFADT